MRITNDLVGKKVTRGIWGTDVWVKVSAIGEKRILGIEKDGSENPYENDDYWLLFPEDKKPSEIIEARVKERSAPEMNSFSYLALEINEIRNYLDELHSQGRLGKK